MKEKTGSKKQLILELEKCRKKVSDLEEKIAKCKNNEILLREIHHRARNNMQIISSLLRLQAKKIKDKKLIEILDVCQNRIQSIALIHEKFQKSKDPARIELAHYIQDLAVLLYRSHGADPNVIRLNTEMENIQVDIDRAIPFGLIVNEVLTNSLRHAFPDGKNGEIRIRLRAVNQRKLEFVLIDNGVGFPEDAAFHKTDSLGLQLVNELAEQIGGDIKLVTEGGTIFKITF